MKIAMGLGKTSPAGVQYTVKAQVLNRNRQLQLPCQRCPRPRLWSQSLKPSIHLSFHRSLPLQCQNQPQIQGISQLNLVLLRLRQLLVLFFVQVPSEFQSEAKRNHQPSALKLFSLHLYAVFVFFYCVIEQ